MSPPEVMRGCLFSSMMRIKGVIETPNGSLPKGCELMGLLNGEREMGRAVKRVEIYGLLYMRRSLLLKKVFRQSQQLLKPHNSSLPTSERRYPRCRLRM